MCTYLCLYHLKYGKDYIIYIFISFGLSRNDSLFETKFKSNDFKTLETALIVMMVLIYLITVSPFGGITREILDPETRRKALEKKPYVR